jgi:hypothetical protein
MAKPGADGIDVHACPKKMRGGRVTYGVWPDSFLAHFRHAVRGGTGISCHDFMDAEACQRLRATIEEHSFLNVAPSDEASQGIGCGSPERAYANLASLAVEAHRRQRAVCAAVQAEIFDAYFGGFFCPCSRVVQKQQYGAIPTA